MDDLIAQFVAVTGGTTAEARQLLEVCDRNLESAINVFLEGGVSNVPPSNPPSVAAAAAADEEYVRAPIAPVRGRLVDEPYAYSVGPPAVPKNAFERQPEAFRDFREEARMSAKDLEKQDTLSKLFRPPLEVMFAGTFDQAKEHGQQAGKWLLVNIQKIDEFPCQILNRDIWKDERILKLVQSHFVLWQMNSDTVEGQRYMRFYPFEDFPYIAALHPQTGELLQTWGPVIERDDFLASLQDFTIMNDVTGARQSPPRKKQKTIIDLDEEEQMRAAIALSMAENKAEKTSHITISSSDDDGDSIDGHNENGNHGAKEKDTTITTIDLDSDESDDTEKRRKGKGKGKEPAVIDVPEPPANANASEVTRLQIRMEDGSRIVRRFWRKDDVATLFNFVAYKHNRSIADFEIMMVRDQLRERIGQTLEEAGVLNAVVNVVLASS